MRRRHALELRWFRSVLLAIVGIPVLATYVWIAVLQPLVFGLSLGDFQESYMRAAGRLAAGLDPYDLCRTMGCLEPTGPQYVMPPFLAWALQPLVGLPAHATAPGVVVVLNISLAIFIWTSLRALRVRDWQLAVLMVILALGFEPTASNVDEGQVNLVLLALSGVWLLAWVEDRWWGGFALGAAIAVKLIQGPVALLMLWARRWAMLAAAALAGLVLWAVGAPQHLFEYLTSVLPAVSQGTGLFENHSPGGTVTRLFAPDSFFGAVRGSPTGARLITIAIAVAALVATAYVMRSPSPARGGRALEAAAAVAVTPLVATYSWGTHLVLLLLPMFVLVEWAVRRRDWAVAALVAASWLLIGPAHKLLQTLIVSGYSDVLVLRLLAEAGVAGVAVLWIASLLSVARERSAHRADAAHKEGAEGQQHDRAREDHAVAGVV